ncbi:MAG: hypothetical protein IKZ47_04805 [Clostridia bacterium]|nr:hypothetical protein [Clostridia bacterium]
MISVAPLTDKTEIASFYKTANLEPAESAGCVVARSGEEVLGFCLYDLYEKGITVRYITPRDDLSLADGILRSALHVAASRSAMDARYEGEENEILFSKLGFVLDKNDRKLDIDKLFRGCGCERH